MKLGGNSMLRKLTRASIAAAIMVVVSAPISASATMLERVGLSDMTDRADKIFRGTVTDIRQTSVRMGGGDVPVINYRFRVDEQLKGDADVVKGNASFIELKMVGYLKEPKSPEGITRFSIFKDMPRLQLGQDYVIFSTPRSSFGLSSTIGLGQGAFSVFSENREVLVVNNYNNENFEFGEGGPISYSKMKKLVASRMTKKAGE